MSSLTYWEQDYVHKRMSNYDIKFQEIYNELFDHIVTAIEEKKAAGDTGSVERLYTDVVDTQFGGFYGVENVAKSHEKGYKSKVKKMIWGNFRHFINIKTVVFTVTTLAASFYLPHTKLNTIILTIALLISVLYPSAYAYIKLRRIRPSKGKTSLIYSHTITQANFPLILLNSLLWLPQIPFIFSNDDTHFKLINVPLPWLCLLLAFFVIYDMSSMRLCRQELKQFVNLDPHTNET